MQVYHGDPLKWPSSVGKIYTEQVLFFETFWDSWLVSSRPTLPTFPSPWPHSSWTVSFWTPNKTWCASNPTIEWSSQSKLIGQSKMFEDSVSDVVREIGKDNLLLSSLFIGSAAVSLVFCCQLPWLSGCGKLLCSQVYLGGNADGHEHAGRDFGGSH